MGRLLVGHPPSTRIGETYAYCARLARTHYENFTVASWLLPGIQRNHAYAIYAFCHSVDDLGDAAQGDRPLMRGQDEP